MLAHCSKEDDRLAALQRVDILDTPREESFDRITRLARKALNVPIAHISFIDGHRQWLKSAEGIGATEVPRDQTFCRRVIESGEPLIIPDASLDARFADSPFVCGEPGIRFYAGFPLKTAEGHDIGTLCAIDIKPRDVSADEVQAMNDSSDS
jgi:GAF domain-containing protein